MTITDHIGENAFGTLINYKRYQSLTPTKNDLLFFHGTGERGPIDGSQLPLLEKHGPPKHAKAGFEYPFNIYAIQAQGEINANFAQIRKIFAAYIKLKYDSNCIITTGLSAGGFCTFDSAKYDSLNLISAIAPICGGANELEAPLFPNIPGWAFHGDKDDKVGYRRSLDFVQGFNKTHTQQMKYTLYPGVGHDSWTKAYSTKPGEDELLQWFIQKFNEAPKSTGLGFLDKQTLLDFIMTH